MFSSRNVAHWGCVGRRSSLLQNSAGTANCSWSKPLAAAGRGFPIALALKGVNLHSEVKPAEGAGETATSARSRRPRGTIVLKPERCKGCGFCIAFCPPKVLAFSAAFNTLGYHPPELIRPEGCTGCDLCGLYCPDFAIYGVMLKDSTAPPADAVRAEEAA